MDEVLPSTARLKEDFMTMKTMHGAKNGLKGGSEIKQEDGSIIQYRRARRC